VAVFLFINFGTIISAVDIVPDKKMPIQRINTVALTLKPTKTLIKYAIPPTAIATEYCFASEISAVTCHVVTALNIPNPSIATL